jgi:hypothetical protein
MLLPQNSPLVRAAPAAAEDELPLMPAFLSMYPLAGLSFEGGFVVFLIRVRRFFG